MKKIMAAGTGPYRGVIFDFDGVVADTERYHFAAWNRAAEVAGTRLAWQEYLPLKSTGRGHIIGAIEKKAGTALTPEQWERMARIKAEVFRREIAGLSRKDIIPGIPAFLDALQAWGIPAAVASSSVTTAELARKLGLAERFAAVIDGNSGLPRKPEPDLFLAAAGALALAPEDCLVFEDSLAGVEAAVRAGMGVVAVGGIRPEGALAWAEDFTEISSVVTAEE